MKPGQSPTGERFKVPPPPPREHRFQTAPRPTSYAPRSAGPAPPRAPRSQRSWDKFENAGPFTSGTEPSAGFPGLSRTQSTRKPQGFTPATPGGDEPPAPRTSAYATLSRRERPQASTFASHFPERSTDPSPQSTPHMPGRSPLRQARSSSRVEEDRRPQRPGLERVSSQYSGIGGERTDVGSAGVGRSSSVRNSPVESRPHEHERNGIHDPFPQSIPNRHHSSSPKLRPASAHVYSSSDSDTSSDEDIEEQRWASRPKATPRQMRPTLGDAGRRASADGQAFTSQFPGTSYVKPPTPREMESSRHQYRPSPPLRNQPVSQAAFNYVPRYPESRTAAQHSMPGEGNGYPGAGAPADGPKMYAPFHSSSREWSESFCLSPSEVGKSVPSLNGFPSWAVPSSVLPRKRTPQKHTLDTVRKEKGDWVESSRSNTCHSTFIERLRKQGKFADSAYFDSSLDTDTAEPPSQPRFQSTSHEDVSRKFFPSEWTDKFSGAEDLFRPSSSESCGKRSPVRLDRSRAKSYTKAQTFPIQELPSEVPVRSHTTTKEDSTTAEAFIPSKFASEEWLEKLRYQTTDVAEDSRMKTSARAPKAPAPKHQPASPRSHSSSAEKRGQDVSADEGAGAGQKINDDVDPMDIDDSFPSSVPSTPSDANEGASAPQHAPEERGRTLGTAHSDPHSLRTAAVGVNLEDLSNVAPLKPSDTGLGDLQDLGTTLPFESKASPGRPSQIVTNGIAFSSLKALDLPKPPRHVIPPLEGVTQEAWTRYTTQMSTYMHDWHIFNKKMLDHFQARQAQLDMTLMSNWMSTLGDGPTGEEISRKLQENPSATGIQKAGYTAYQQWMEEDMKVREWWNVACERHRQAVMELGKVRGLAKPLAVI